MSDSSSTPAPPLAGLCNYEEAGRTGVLVDKTVMRLRRWVYLHGGLVRIISAHLNAVPEWEVKCALSLHIWQTAEHNNSFRERVAEMRTPPHHLDESPDPALDALLEELIHSRTTVELLVGIYRVLLPAMTEAMTLHSAEANPVADYPTRRLIRMFLLEKHDQLEWGARALEQLEKIGGFGARCEEWEAHLRSYLSATGGVNGDDVRPSGMLPSPRAATPFEPERIPQRDQRFTHSRDSRGAHSNVEAVPGDRLWFMAYVRLTEMHVPELLALILYDWKEPTWPMIHDLCRHLWDECRHSMMGEAVFARAGAPWWETAQELSFARYPNTQLDSAPERYALLWHIEQGLMGKDGKQAEYELAEGQSPLLAMFQDYDWADEVLHAKIGRKWLLPEFDHDRDTLTARALQIREEYNAIVERDQKQPGADWWEGFYTEYLSDKRTG